MSIKDEIISGACKHNNLPMMCIYCERDKVSALRKELEAVKASIPKLKADKVIELKDIAAKILQRVDVAANGQISTSMWSEPDENLSAPDGMDYWSWIEDAESDLFDALDKIISQ